MKVLKKKLGFDFPYLYDETQEVAKEYQAQCTPDIYLFKKNRLYYHGQINDKWDNPEQASTEDLQEALENLINGKETNEQQTPSKGCSIKWK